MTTGDEVDRYLKSRGLALPEYPKVLRFHPALGYYQKDADGTSRKRAEYPAMLACIQGADGHAVTLHRTYLQDDGKLAALDAKKVLSAGINGAAVWHGRGSGDRRGDRDRHRRAPCDRQAGVAGLNAGNLERLWLPESVRKVCIYADNDADGDFAGQAFACALARRLKQDEEKTGPREVRVFLPRQAGMDWADVWRLRLEARVPRAA